MKLILISAAALIIGAALILFTPRFVEGIFFCGVTVGISVSFVFGNTNDQ